MQGSDRVNLLEIFKAGNWTTVDGQHLAFSAADLVATAEAYDPVLFKAPLVIGHPALNDPAYGWVSKLDVAQGTLLAEREYVEPQFATMVNDGRFPKISASFFAPHSKDNPVPGVWYLRHVGFLGAVAPAVAGLKPASFAIHGMDYAEFSSPLSDLVLANIAIGYQNAEFVGHRLFPRATVYVSGGQVIKFGTEGFRKYNLRRAPGANTAQVQFGYGAQPFALVQDALESVVPREWLRDATVTPGVQLGTRAVQLGLDVVQLALEHDQALLATDAANYGADNKVDLAASSWNDPDRNPITDFTTAQEAVGDQIGHDPNVLVLSGKAFAALRSNPHILERFSGLSAGAISREQLAGLLDVPEIVIGRARFENAAGNMNPVWGTHAVLAYAAPAGSSIERPSYGYTYTMDGHPLVEPAYYDQNRKSWVYPMAFERVPLVTCSAAGYLFENAGAPFV